jgi:hypothetical protein
MPFEGANPMRILPNSMRWLFALLTAAIAATACSTHPTDAQPPTTVSTRQAPDNAGTPTATTPVRLVASGNSGQAQPQQLNTADYKEWAVQVYNQELTLIHQEQQTLANETAPAPTRATQITSQLLPQLQQLLGQAQAIQPVETSTAELHQHLINALQLMIAAYQDFATGFTQNDAAVLARGRSELTAEGQELGIWVHGVPQL